MLRYFSRSLVLILCPYVAMAEIPSAERWLSHLNDDLLPFFETPLALGTPVGNFPTVRCNDGSIPDPDARCTEVGRNAALDPTQSVVALSRQSFAYGVAFHMTGETRYLEFAQAGVDRLMTQALDTESGLFFDRFKASDGAWTHLGEGTDAQRQAYGLLAPTFLYYLTRDEGLFDDIRGVQAQIEQTFGQTGTAGAISDTPLGTAPSTRLSQVLDQVNAYQYLLTATAPEAVQAEMKTALATRTAHIRDAFFDEEDGIFLSRSDQPEGDLSGIDFGHAAKTLWYSDLVGSLTDAPDTSGFSRAAFDDLNALAFLTDLEAWSEGFDGEGAISRDQTWWITNELNQYLASLSVEDSAFLMQLEQVQTSYLDQFVDTENGGIWLRIDGETGTPRTDLKKQWEWKSGFHEFEHALVSYLAAAGREGGDIPMYFAFAQPVGLGHLDELYTFQATANGIESLTDGETDYQRVLFDGLSFGAAVLPVPLPPSLIIFLSGLGAMVLVRRKRCVFWA
jgi:mannose/cellobiose epimerase-like protein (N-acyl-D-glucosamine 2-epimerase family)